MNVKRLTTISIMVALTVILSQIIIPSGPIPISFSLLGVYMCAIVLKPKDAVLSQLIYIFMGMIGLPVFAGFRGGIGVLFSYTGGFIISYPLIAFIISFAILKFYEKNKILIVSAFVFALLVCYTLGVLWFSYVSKTSIDNSMMLVVVPFVVGDIIKIIIALTLIYPIKKYLITQRSI